MESPMKQAAKLLQNKKGGYRKLAVFLCLALLVTAGTVTAFVLHGQAQEHTRRVLQCTAVHQHTEDCYPDGDISAEPVCGLADFVVHTHNDDCYNEQGELVCTIGELEAHTHSEEEGCYTRPLICGLEEIAAHAHTADCYAEADKELACGQEERPAVEAVEGHTHTEACYEIPRTLICGEEERPAVEPVAAVEGDPGHAHSEACYDENGELVCGEEERDPVEPVAAVEGDPGHTHTDECYSSGEPVLVCGKEEAEPVEGDPGHTHTPECYTVKEGALPACGLEETEGHTHTEECYGEPELICQKAEIELHTHTDECYETHTVTVDGEEVEEKVLICGKLQIEEHTHTEETCFVIETLTPEEVEQLETETQQPEVVELQQVYENENLRVIVDYDSTALLPEDAAIRLVSAAAPQPVLDASQMVVPEAPAEPAEGEPAAGEPTGEPEPAAAGEPSAPAEPETPTEPEPSAPAAPETPAEPEPSAPAEPETPTEPEPSAPAAPETPAEPEPSAPAEPAEGGADLVRAGFVAADGREWLPASTVTYTVQYLLEGQPAGEPVQYTFTPGSSLPSFAAAIARFTQTVETDEFIVTASYTALANLPAEAQLRASLITGQEQLDQYTAQYREAVSSSKAQLQALLDIGFWVGEGEQAAEVQPAAPVAITVQLLGEDGLPAGAPLMVVHFGQNGAEVIESKADEEGAAAFKMNSFSPVGIGQVPESDEEGRALLGEGNGTFEWTDPNGLYHVTFQVNGVIAPKTEEPAAPEAPEGEAGEPPAPEGEGETPAPEGEGETPAAPETPEGEPPAPEGEEGETPAAPETPEGEPAGEPEGEEGEEGEPPATEGETPAAIDTANIPVATASLLSFTVETVGEEDAAYAAYAQAAQQDAGELLNLAVMRYSLSYGGVEMDLSNCEIKVTVTPTAQVQTAAGAYNQAQLEEYEQMCEEDDGLVMSEDGTVMLPAPEPELGVLFSAYAPAENAEAVLSTQGTIVVGEDAVAGEPVPAVANFALPLDQQPAGIEIAAPPQTEGALPGVNGDTPLLDTESANALRPAQQGLLEDSVTFTITPASRSAAPPQARDTVATTITGQPNPTFTVEYYANLTVLDTNGNSASELKIIDTSGGTLPKNGDAITFKSIYVYNSGSKKGQIKTKVEQMPVYASREFQYVRAPSLIYFNDLRENPGYKLVAIWIKKAGSASWKEISVKKLSDVHFTNREGMDGYITITQGATIRLVYDTLSPQPKPVDAAFFDYNITEGKPKTIDGRKVLDAYNAGINKTDEDKIGDLRYAFGNSNMGTAFGTQKWKNNKKSNELNKFNEANRNNGGYGCTFSLVTGMKENGTEVVFRKGITSPAKLFANGKQHGRQQYSGSLQFIRVGDTYTLTSVSVQDCAGAKNLHKFNNPKVPSDGHVYPHIWTNNFWPMDKAKNAVDPMFGKVVSGSYNSYNRDYSRYNGKPGAQGTTVAQVPPSDDGLAHNSYFGMRYAVSFTLSERYIGPLEYYFFGDDDMWVFLTDDKGNSQLVCDIGGVHSSVGEYINLWDYIDGTKENHRECKYTLTFFYTERGASGSTCWMQFTLPSVETLDPGVPDAELGGLTVKKTVKRQVNGGKPEEVDNGETFRFTIKLTDANGNHLPDAYAYKKYGADGKEIVAEADLIVFDGATFYLKNGERIEVEYLPIGTQYTITEDTQVHNGTSMVDSNYVYTTSTSLNGGTPEERLTYTGTISKSSKESVDTVEFINAYHAYELPKTGGLPSIAYTGAGAVLVMLAAAAYAQRRRKKTADSSAK